MQNSRQPQIPCRCQPVPQRLPANARSRATSRPVARKGSRLARTSFRPSDDRTCPSRLLRHPVRHARSVRCPIASRCPRQLSANASARVSHRSYAVAPSTSPACSRCVLVRFPCGGKQGMWLALWQCFDPPILTPIRPYDRYYRPCQCFYGGCFALSGPDFSAYRPIEATFYIARTHLSSH